VIGLTTILLLVSGIVVNESCFVKILIRFKGDGKEMFHLSLDVIILICGLL